MTQKELLERAGGWLELPYPQNREDQNRQELNTLYHAITGKYADCSSCTNWLIRMAAKLREYVASPDSFTIQPDRKTMAKTSSKYQISKAAIANGTEVVTLNHDNGASEAIYLNNMTDAQAERILKSKRYAHNVEVIKAKDEATAKPTAAKSAPKTAKAAETKAEAPAPEKAVDTDKG